MHLLANLHLITEHRSRRHRAARRADHGRSRPTAETLLRTPRAPQEPQPRKEQGQTEQQPVESQALREDLQIPDVALRRVRESGGPLDHASYACQCGYVFQADVSTTVECPHCHVAQAW